MKIFLVFLKYWLKKVAWNLIFLMMIPISIN